MCERGVGLWRGCFRGSCGVTNVIFGAVRVNVVVLSWWFVFDRENKKLAAAVSVLKKRIFAVKQSFFGGTTQSGHASPILQNEITVESGEGGRGKGSQGVLGVRIVWARPLRK